MAKKSDKEQEAGLPKEFSNLKEKHPDALLLFRVISTGFIRRMPSKPP